MIKHRRFKKRYIPIACFALFQMIAHSGYLAFRMNAKKQQAYLIERNAPLPAIQNYSSSGRSIRYTHIGSDSLPLVLFIHGSPGSSSAYIDYLADHTLLEKTQMISVDRPGFGFSGYGKSSNSLAEQSALFKTLLERHPSKQVILVGHSLGGPLIARMAMDYQKLISGLVMIAPSIDPELEPREWWRKPINSIALRWMLPGSLKASNREILFLYKDLNDMLPMWKNITVPVTVIQGDKDNLVPKENADFAKKMLINNSSVTIKMLAGQDHFVLWSEQDLIVKSILELLN